MKRFLPQRLWVYLKDRTTAYKLTFSGTPGEMVLDDLAKFCRASTSTFDPDPRVHAVLEGRREVWLRIQHHLSLTASEVYEHATGGVQPPQMEDDQ